MESLEKIAKNRNYLLSKSKSSKRKTSDVISLFSESSSRLIRISNKVDKHLLGRHPTPEWQQNFFDLYSSFFSEVYNLISHSKNLVRMLGLGDLLYRRSTPKFLENLSGITEVNLETDIEVLGTALKIRERFFVHPEKVGGYDWVTTTHSIFFVKENRKSSSPSMFNNSETVFPPPIKDVIGAVDKIECVLIDEILNHME